MSSSYPGSLDAFPDPVGTTALNSSEAGLAHALQHTNSNDAIEAIQAALGTLPAGAYASVRVRLEAIDTNLATGAHTHTIANVSGLQAALDAKAATSHTHAQSSITNLVTDLSAKARVTPSVVAKPLGVAAVGIDPDAARADHVHLLPTLGTLGAAATSTTISAGSGLTGGGDLSASRSLAANFAASGGDGGTATTVARGDHFHDGRYFTESEADARFSAVAHNHNATYARTVALVTGTALPSAASYSEGDLVLFY